MIKAARIAQARNQSHELAFSFCREKVSKILHHYTPFKISARLNMIAEKEEGKNKEKGKKKLNGFVKLQ